MPKSQKRVKAGKKAAAKRAKGTRKGGKRSSGGGRPRKR